MKKIIAILLAAALLLALTACGSKPAQTPAQAPAADAPAAEAPAAPANQLETIQANGKIVIAMEGAWRPWTFHNADDALVGFDTEVGAAIAEKLGVEATYVEGEWDSLFAGLDSGRYDIIINGVEVTPAREEKYDFGTPYCFVRTALIVRADNEDIKTFDDLAGKKTCNSIGSTYMELAESYGASADGVDTLDETLSIVLSGRADATLNALDSFADYMAEHPEAQLKVVAVTEDSSPVAIPVRKGESELRAAIDAAIAELQADGTIAALSEKYFGSDISKE